MALCIKAHLVIDILNTSHSMGMALQTVFKGVVYLAFTLCTTMAVADLGGGARGAVAPPLPAISENAKE